MGAIAVQGAVGGAGSKATTILPESSFNSIAEINGFPIGANSSGLFSLNDSSGNHEVTAIVSMATTDFGLHNPKRIRFLYVGIDTSAPFTVAVSADDQGPIQHAVVNKKGGLQRIRVPINRNMQGRYWKITISSTAWFRLDSLKVLPVVRPSGVEVY